MQILPFITNIPDARQRRTNNCLLCDASSGVGRLILAFAIVAGVLTGLEIAAKTGDINGERRVADAVSFEQRGVRP
jgi:hypothetical protein